MGKILICHPDEKTRESLKLILCDHYELILTNDFAQAQYILENAKDITLFMLNIDSSKEFGPKNVKAVLDEYPKLKIVVLSEQKFKAKAEETAKYGATELLFNPFKTNEILTLVKRPIK